MENFNMLVLHTIIWRRRWRRKRRYVWVHQINIKDQNLEYLATYTGICSRIKRNFMALLERTSSNSTVCHSWWQRKYENKTPLHLKNDLQLF